MIDMPTTMEIDQWLQCNLGGNILLAFCSCELLGEGVEAVDIGLVVVLVVKLHDFAGDGGFEGAIII